MESFLLHRVNPGKEANVSLICATSTYSNKKLAEDVNSMGIRLRLYGCERMRRERLIGEAVVSFANINLELENNFWLILEARANTAVSTVYTEESNDVYLTDFLITAGRLS